MKTSEGGGPAPTTADEAPVLPESPYTSAFLRHKDDQPAGLQIQRDAKIAHTRVDEMLSLEGVADEIRASEPHEKVVFARRVPGFTPTGP